MAFLIQRKLLKQWRKLIGVYSFLLGLQLYVDSPMAIGYDVTISAPHMHAMCLQLLEKNLQPGMRALAIGSGCHVNPFSGDHVYIDMHIHSPIFACPLSFVVLFL